MLAANFKIFLNIILRVYCNIDEDDALVSCNIWGVQLMQLIMCTDLCLHALVCHDRANIF